MIVLFDAEGNLQDIAFLQIDSQDLRCTASIDLNYVYVVVFPTCVRIGFNLIKNRFKFCLTWMSRAEADTQVLNMDAKDVAMVGQNEGAPEGVDITVDNGGGGGAKKVR